MAGGKVALGAPNSTLYGLFWFVSCSSILSFAEMSPAFFKIESPHCCITATANSSPCFSHCWSTHFQFQELQPPTGTSFQYPSVVTCLAPPGCSNEQGLAIPDETFLYHNGLLIKPSLSLNLMTLISLGRKKRRQRFSPGAVSGWHRPLNGNELNCFG